MSLRLLSVMIAVVLSATPAFSQVEDGVTDTTIKLGASIDMSGPQKESAKNYRQGMELYWNHVNQSGGIFGRKIEYIVLDDSFNPRKAAENTKKLAEEDKVFAFVMSIGTPTAKAAIPLINKKLIPFLMPIVTTEDFVKPIQKNIFTVRRIAPHEIDSLIAELVDRRKLQSIAILRDDSGLGVGAKSGADAAFKKRGKKLAVDGMTPFTSTDLKEAFDKVFQAAPQAVIFASTQDRSIEFIKMMKAKNWKPTLAFASPAFSPAVVEALKADGREALFSHFTPHPSATTYEIVGKYIAHATAANLTPEIKSLEGYINAAVLHEALTRVGKDLTREKLLKTLESMTDVNIGGLKLRYGPNDHQGLSKTYLIQLKDGELKHYEP